MMQALNGSIIEEKLKHSMQIESQAINIIDEIMSQCSLNNLVRKVEQLLPKFFNCERATLVLVHRFKKHQFRIK